MERFIFINGQKVPVSEEVYFTFKRPMWREIKRTKVRRSHEISLDVLADLSSGEDLICGQIENKLLRERLASALVELSAGEQRLIRTLFWEEMSERQLAIETGVPRKTLAYRKMKVLKKLKRLMEA